MPAFDYIRAASVGEACAILHKFGKKAKIIAGGTDLLVEARGQGLHGAETVVDISRLDSLRGIEEKNGMIIVRPLTTHAELMRSDILRARAPFLAAAASTIGSPQIRNRGTVGGNIMNAATCADTVPPLIAMGARAVLRSTRGKRTLALSELFSAPYRTHARPDEILVELTIPKLPPGARTSFIKLGRRNALSISRLSVAAIVTQGKDGTITDARIVPGAAFPTWRRVGEAERILVGQRPSQELFAEAGRKVSDAMTASVGTRWSSEYKVPVLAVLVRRALERCSLTKADEEHND
jgi:carbon-monoxide dehydrogenase medium subunit/xanthine dehydrogenase FAD-binding subunit